MPVKYREPLLTRLLWKLKLRQPKVKMLAVLCPFPPTNKHSRQPNCTWMFISVSLQWWLRCPPEVIRFSPFLMHSFGISGELRIFFFKAEADMAWLCFLSEHPSRPDRGELSCNSYGNDKILEGQRKTFRKKVIWETKRERYFYWKYVNLTWFHSMNYLANAVKYLNLLNVPVMCLGSST